MKLGVMHPNGGLTDEIDLDQGTLLVTDASDDVVKKEDWEHHTEETIAGPVNSTGDGLIYRMVIRVDDLEDTDLVIKRYLVNAGLMDEDLYSLFEDLDGLSFATHKQAWDAVSNIIQDVAKDPEAEPVPIKEEEIDRYIDSYDVPTFGVGLYLVPVSVSRKVMFNAVGYTEDYQGDDGGIRGHIDECFKEEGHYGYFVDDLVRYGHGVPIPLTKKDGLEIICGEDSLESSIRKAKEQAYAVMSMLGFFMDRPVNALGETGWDLLRNAEAFPGQHRAKPTDTTTIECDDCGEEEECCKVKTIYGSKEEWLCQKCMEDYYVCPDCGVLVPISPQSYSGVEWVEIRHEYYCSDCASKIYQSDKCPKTVPGGTVLLIQDIRKFSQNLAMVQLGGSWMHGDEDGGAASEWSVGWYPHNCTEAQISKYICEAVERGQKDEEFIFGPNSHSQFESTIGLYWRKKP